MKSAWKLAILGAVLLGGASQSRANYTYSLAGMPGSVHSGHSFVDFTSPSSQVLPANASSAIAVANVQAFTSNGLSKDQFNAPVSFLLSFADANGSASATFNGTLTGNLDTTGSSLQIRFSNPVMDTFTLSNVKYDVAIEPVVNVPAHGVTAIGAAIRPEGPAPPPVQQSPEPSSLLLAGLAGLSLVPCWRLRRSRPAAGEPLPAAAAEDHRCL